MSDRLTPDELAEIDRQIAWYNATQPPGWMEIIGGSNLELLFRARAHIAALEVLVRELTADERAGIDGSGVYAECMCCGQIAMTNLWRDVVHAPDCPIVRGREMVRHVVSGQEAERP